ncbi:NUDIX domain-containing protein [Teredinibacter purpureus]|uniref:NUDIX domain-containing protein n=1 Tax=Teredinibacter purpureus TaxID=2731756 RepID=UPI0005F80C79|nr:NUDIX hydrolase [Teredinibacter purpureus]
MKEIETLNSTVVYRNKWMTVREDCIQRSSGHQGIFGVVEKTDFVVIIPVDNDYIHIVEQYRYPVKARFWELPQGSWEENPKADPALLAAGELQEETGLLSRNMQYIGHQYLAYGYSNQGYHIYLAKDLVRGEQALEAEEEGLVSKKVTIEEFEQMILSGKIKDATTVNAYNLAKLKGAI